IGVLATVSSGPLRFVPPGRLHTAAHLLLAASVGLSIWAVPAAALALYRLGVRRRAVLDVAAILLVAGTSMLALSIDARIRDAAPEVEVLAAMGVMVVLALIPLLIGHVVGTRHELLASLRERTDSAERERETARSAADAAEREAAALVREHEAETARVRAEARTALARDMHDSISHHLAAIAMHSRATAHREDLPPEALRPTARTARAAAPPATRALRAAPSGLRTGEGGAPLATAPTLAGIVDRCREGGQEVELTWQGASAEELAARDRSTVVALARILGEVTLNAEIGRAHV